MATAHAPESPVATNPGPTPALSLTPTSPSLSRASNKPTLTVGQSHAHAFLPARGWEDALPVGPCSGRRTAMGNSSDDRPKWTLGYNRFELTGSSSSPGASSSRGRAMPSSTSASRDDRTWATLSATQELPRSRSVRSEPGWTKSSSEKATPLPRTPWKWTHHIIPDPDYPDGPPECISPRPTSRREGPSSSRTDLRLRVDDYFGILSTDDGHLSLAELAVYGSFGSAGTFWGHKITGPALCQCKSNCEGGHNEKCRLYDIRVCHPSNSDAEC